jgi:hypothetical protein
MVHVHVNLAGDDFAGAHVRVRTDRYPPDAGPVARVDLPEVVLTCRPPEALSAALRRWADQIDEQAAALEREAVAP